jgi:hypothetical protein
MLAIGYETRATKKPLESGLSVVYVFDFGW